jgi:N-acetylglucosamine-6-phosphate deacetylase
VRLGVKGALAGGELIDGDVHIEDGVIARVGASPAGSDGIAVPGFVDVHTNGIAGVNFLTADPEAYRRAGEALARTGVVAYQPTLVSSDEAAYSEPLRVARAATTDDEIGALPLVLGVHLEGPFLSPEWPGAHDLEHLRLPDLGLAERLAGAGGVTEMTLAPELPGAHELIDWLVARDVVVSCGHSDADAAQAGAAFDRGARAITHLYNAHRRWRPRDPGLGGVALVRPDVTVQAIVDGVHLAPETAFGAFLAARERFCLVTDATEGATLRTAPPRLPDGTLAGSVLTMDEAVRNLVASGAGWTDAVHAASTAPARLLGRDDLGRLEPGAPAHVTVLDDGLRVLRTLVRGRESQAVGVTR